MGLGRSWPIWALGVLQFFLAINKARQGQCVYGEARPITHRHRSSSTSSSSSSTLHPATARTEPTSRSVTKRHEDEVLAKPPTPLALALAKQYKTPGTAQRAAGRHAATGSDIGLLESSTDLDNCSRWGRGWGFFPSETPRQPSSGAEDSPISFSHTPTITPSEPTMARS